MKTRLCFTNSVQNIYHCKHLRHFQLTESHCKDTISANTAFWTVISTIHFIWSYWVVKLESFLQQLMPIPIGNSWTNLDWASMKLWNRENDICKSLSLYHYSEHSPASIVNHHQQETIQFNMAMAVTRM
jgi:hypothetical protein